MGRRKANSERLLSRRIQVKVTDSDYKRLRDIQQSSNCKSFSEFARRVLVGKPITILTKDTTADTLMEELIRLRQELHFIGHNVNQITHHFHSTEFPKQKLFYALKAIDELDKIQQPLRKAMADITKIGKQWLQK